MGISKKRIRKIEKIEERRINYSDIPELKSSFWNCATVVLPKNKEAISIRMEGEVLDWFRSHGKGYQTLINAVLRSYMDAKRGRRKQVR